MFVETGISVLNRVRDDSIVATATRLELKRTSDRQACDDEPRWREFLFRMPLSQSCLRQTAPTFSYWSTMTRVSSALARWMHWNCIERRTLLNGKPTYDDVPDASRLHAYPPRSVGRPLFTYVVFLSMVHFPGKLCDGLSGPEAAEEDRARRDGGYATIQFRNLTYVWRRTTFPNRVV